MSSLTSAEIESVAARLADAYVSRQSIGGHEALGDEAPTSVDDGYAIQTRMRELADIDPAGWKVGATSEIAQQILGVDEPFLGRMDRGRIVDDAAAIPVGQWFVAEPAIEVEVGLRPTVALSEVPDDPMELAEVVEVVPCIEIVDSRFGAVIGPPGPCLVADNGVASALVVGDPLDLDADGVRRLDEASVTLRVDDADPIEGVGAMAMGHPLTALATAARIAIGLGTAIAAGEVVSTGTCTGLTPVAPGTAARGTVGSGSLSITFT